MIEIKELHRAFGQKQVLNGVDLKIETGDTICIIGKSGSGKSVLLKHIVGLLEPDQGDVKVDGMQIDKLSSKELFNLRTKLGYVFQGAALFDSMSVFENVVLGLYEHGVRDEALLKDEACRTLSSVGLLPAYEERESQAYINEWNNLSAKMPSDLSGGMKKRVGVARALVGKPTYVFYDEPTTGLDPVTSEQIDKLIAQLTHSLNVTSIVITHDMFTVDRVAHTVAMLNNGKVQFYGTPEELKKADDPVVEEFLKRYEE